MGVNGSIGLPLSNSTCLFLSLCLGEKCKSDSPVGRFVFIGNTASHETVASGIDPNCFVRDAIFVAQTNGSVTQRTVTQALLVVDVGTSPRDMGGQIEACVDRVLSTDDISSKFFFRICCSMTADVMCEVRELMTDDEGPGIGRNGGEGTRIDLDFALFERTSYRCY